MSLVHSGSKYDRTADGTDHGRTIILSDKAALQQLNA